MDKKIKIGIIGCDYWGRNLLRNFAENTDCQIVGCADLDSSNLKIVREKYPHIDIMTPSQLTNNPKIEALVIASGLSTHYELANEAIRKGKHILFDKLIASNSQEAKELVRLEQAKKAY